MHACQSWLLWLGLFLASCAQLHSQGFPLPAPKDSVKILIDAQRIETARIWEDGSPSAQSEAFSMLLHDDDAASAFASLFKSASGVAGRLYALLGLSRCNPQQYTALARSLTLDQVVPVLWYDVMREMRVSEILKMIEDGSLYKAVYPPPAAVDATEL